MVLDKGHIIEDGNYDELIAQNGFFAELVARQRLDEPGFVVVNGVLGEGLLVTVPVIVVDGALRSAQGGGGGVRAEGHQRGALSHRDL